MGVTKRALQMALEDVTYDEASVVWEALSQYVANNDPEEYEPHKDPVGYAAAQSLLDRLDAAVASLADEGVDS